MDYNKLAELLFPHITGTPEDIEAIFPRRTLPEGAKVTRIAPSPTGFMHFGTLFPALVSERLAHTGGGVLYLRIEDTDSQRFVPGAEKYITEALNWCGMKFDEGVNEVSYLSVAVYPHITAAVVDKITDGLIGCEYKIMEIDITRKKGWAKKYGVLVDAEKTACVIELNKGELVREINLDQDLAAQM